MLQRKKTWIDKQRKITYKQYKLLIRLVKSFSCMYCSDKDCSQCSKLIDCISKGKVDSRTLELLKQIKAREAQCDIVERDDALNDD